MVDIFVHPSDLRKTVEQLRSSAQKISQSLKAIDTEINSLKGDAFLGNRAAILQSRYTIKRGALLKAHQIVLHFAEDLLNAADAFEHADKAQIAETLPSSAGLIWNDRWLLPVLPLFPNKWFPEEGIPWQRILPSLSLNKKLQLPDWLKSRIANIFKPVEISSPVSISFQGAEEKPTSGFGQLTQDHPVIPGEQDPSFEASKLEHILNSPITSENLVPVKAQGNLYGGAGCAPTSVSMVLEYYHNQDSANQTISADELIKMMDEGDGTFGKGVSLSNLTDELTDLGYKNITQQVGADFSSLRDSVQNGPVIVTAGVKIVGPGTISAGVPRALDGPGNTIHAMVVTSIDDTINVNDPWTGQALQIPKETFDKMWSRGSKGLYAIKP